MDQKKKLIELILNAPRTDTVYGNIKLDKPVQTAQTIADHLLANGVIVLPCRFLQKCLVKPTISNGLKEETVMKCIGFSLSHDSYNANLLSDKNKLYQPSFGEFGKTVCVLKEGDTT